MTDHASEQHIELVIPDDDLVLPFEAERADVFGRLVRLGPTVDAILTRHDYADPVSDLLGQAVVLTALLGASLKSEGKFILQASTDGPVDLLVADYEVPGRLRGYARFSPERVAAASIGEDGQAELLGKGHLAMTIDRGADTERYQGVVPLDGGKGQRSSVRDTLEEMGIERVPLIAIAKGPHHGREGREVFHFPDGREKTLPVNSPLLFYLQTLCDEVHRYAIGAHRAKRSRAITASPLDEIPGIGPSRKRALLLHFGTAGKVRAAALDDLKRAPGISAGVAQQVVPVGYGRVQRLTYAAEDLHNLVYAPPAPFPRAVLYHGCLYPHVFSLVGAPGRLMSEPTHGHDLPLNIG